MSSSLVEIWRKIMVGSEKSWVLFDNGTCVIITTPEADLKTQAVEILREWGPVQVATQSADFSVVHLRDHPGWVVTCHHPDVLTHVGPEELEPEAKEVAVGLWGRSKRNQDAEQLHVVHVHDASTDG